jgi:lipopolysaccharide export system protein LptA
MPRRPSLPSRLAAPWRTWRAVPWVVLAMLGSTVCAETADRYKPTHVEADRMQYDDLKQVNVFTGTVVLTKGTITIRGDRLVLQQDPEGYQYGTAIGRQASFRQKRDGVDEWIEGYGEEIRYDGKADTVRLTGRAKVRRLEGSRVADEIDGAVILYDSRTEQFSVEGSPTAGAPAAAGSGRVRVTIQPRLGESAAATPGSPPAPATGGPLRPAPAAPRPPEPR